MCLFMFITSPAGVVTKYCNEHVYMSVCVCLSASISPEPLTHYLYQFLCMLPIVVARSSSGGVMQYQGELAIWGFYSPLTMHCRAQHLGPIQNG